MPRTKIKELRRISGMSQEELGGRVGLQRAAIQKYEKGTVENIPIKTIENIAKVFDVSPSYILGWDDTNCNPLSAEVKVIQGVSQFFGKDSVDLLEDYMSLTSQGKRRVRQYVADIKSVYEEDTIL